MAQRIISMFQRRHFEVIADTIQACAERRSGSPAGIDVVTALANVFAMHHPQFDRKRFMDACKIREGTQ